MQNLVELMTAVLLAHSFHSLGESANVNNKISRLSDAVDGKTLKPYPVNIDTRLKAYSIGIGMLLVLTLVFYLVINLLSFTTSSLLWISIVTIVFVDIIGTIRFDKYHVYIEKLIKKFDKKGTK